MWTRSKLELKGGNKRISLKHINKGIEKPWEIHISWEVNNTKINDTSKRFNCFNQFKFIIELSLTHPFRASVAMILKSLWIMGTVTLNLMGLTWSRVKPLSSNYYPTNKIILPQYPAVKHPLLPLNEFITISQKIILI